jgi:hypothetical protein
MAKKMQEIAPQQQRPHAGQADDAHTLPRWVNVIQDNLFLSFLILAEAYLLGTLMTLGWVADIEVPSRWGTYHGVGVVLFFLAGAMAAGVVLRCSVKAAGCFSRHEWGMALFNFLGLVLFSGAEIWALLSERSAHLTPTPADQAVLSILGVASAPVSPTVVVVAFLLPFASLYYGFSQQQRRETAEERAEQAAAEDFAFRRRLGRAEAAARRRAVEDVIRREIPGALQGVRAYFRLLELSPEQLIARKQRIALIDLVASGETLGNLQPIRITQRPETQ